ncbi:MAG: hypothetical protein K8I27_01155 [Planctomycetes bacterium]|nr:hypothetical protein [Planctomycetota bacterium]
MNQSRLLIILFAALLIGAASAWFVFSDDDGQANPVATALGELGGPAAAELAPLDVDQPDNPTAPKPGNHPPPLEIDGSVETGERTATDHDESTPGRTDGSRQGQPGSTPGSNPTPGDSGGKPAGKGTPPPPRKPTRAEQEEQRRVDSGRPALQRKLKRTPAGIGSAGDLAKSPDQEKWTEQWHAEGFTPPEMTSTPVHGKIMSEDAREGLAEATVGLISFFPLDGIAGGTLLPVITEFKTDANGFFGGDIPASKLAPHNYPRVAISVTWSGYRVIAGSPLASLEVGKQNEFGIIWAPQTPFVLNADATQFNGELRVVSTGELDPQRWHIEKRAQTFAYFPGFNVAKEVPGEGETSAEQGFAEVIGTWDGKNTPYVSLLGGNELLQTRRPLPATIVSNNSGGAPALPFETLVFENDGFTPISGQVVDSQGGAIAGATVSTVGGDLSQTLVSDAGGWFVFNDPPEKTTALHCVHEDYVENRLTPVVPGDSNMTIVLDTPRPRIHLFVTDKYTQAPILDLSVKVIGLAAWGPKKGKALPEAFTTLTSADGHFLLEWEFAIKNITLEKIGYFPKVYTNPDAIQQQSSGQIDVQFAPSRKLEINPRDYTGVEDANRWFKDPNNGPGIYTAWSHHWIEYEVDFGDEVEEGEQGGKFDIMLGCTNHGIVDNDYEFSVDVYVDGVKQKSALKMLADSLNERTDRMALGALSGVHTVRLVWTNDKWIPDQLDANIRYGSLKFIEQP